MQRFRRGQRERIIAALAEDCYRVNSRVCIYSGGRFLSSSTRAGFLTRMNVIRSEECRGCIQPCVCVYVCAPDAGIMNRDCDRIRQRKRSFFLFFYSFCIKRERENEREY